MKYRLSLPLSALIVSLAPAVAMAQDSDYHPFLSDTFTASLGFMRSSNSFTFESDVIGDPGEDIDFNDSLDVSDHSTFFNGQFNWNFGKEKSGRLRGSISVTTPRAMRYWKKILNGTV